MTSNGSSQSSISPKHSGLLSVIPGICIICSTFSTCSGASFASIVGFDLAFLSPGFGIDFGVGAGLDLGLDFDFG